MYFCISVDVHHLPCLFNWYFPESSLFGEHLRVVNVWGEGSLKLMQRSKLM